jgi:hypothetical protein
MRSDWKLDGAGLHELKRLKHLSYTLGLELVHAFCQELRASR